MACVQRVYVALSPDTTEIDDFMSASEHHKGRKSTDGGGGGRSGGGCKTAGPFKGFGEIDSDEHVTNTEDIQASEEEKEEKEEEAEEKEEEAEEKEEEAEEGGILHTYTYT
jgi:TATA-binding protein-associated factor Taf7